MEKINRINRNYAQAEAKCYVLFRANTLKTGLSIRPLSFKTNQRNRMILRDVGISENVFKIRYNLHTFSLRLEQKISETTVLYHIRQLQKITANHKLSWNLMGKKAYYATTICSAEKKTPCIIIISIKDQHLIRQENPP